MRDPAKPVWRRRGFTLVEVLIALAILGIGILGVTVLFPITLRDSRRAAGKTVAAVYAEGVADALRAQGYEGIAAVADKNLRAIPIFTQADTAYSLYSQPDVVLFYQITCVDDLYASVRISVPLASGITDEYVTYIARH